MCIGIPGQICAIDGVLAKVEVCGIQRDVDLTLVGAVDEQGQPRLGQWVLVHVGFAMSVINEAEARDCYEGNHLILPGREGIKRESAGLLASPCSGI
ncbi:HypC/HybG/HupF family hydrogenase formation chaperone [Klebsiella pneumoniae]|uniref:HypC/HybG/HupF family hydrogenase formation chaperone n=1 Tax=Klebsiella pneumoniae TaxID=573 RepID=UPI000E2BA64A|nr:[NiFe] hydrogenase metallocenter assembly protein HypC [Klebsiella pneumoniae]